MSLLSFIHNHRWFHNDSIDTPTTDPAFRLEICPVSRLFDAANLAQIFGGVDPVFMRELISKIIAKSIEQQDMRLRQLHRAITDGDTTAMGFYCHQLKGSYRSTGASILANLCAEMEQLSQSAALAKVDRLFSLLATLNHLYKDEVGHFLRHEPVPLDEYAGSNMA